MNDQEASHYADRFASTHERDSEFDNQAYHSGATEYLGTLPDDQFHGAARNAYAQTPAPQRAGLIGSLLGSLQGKGLHPAGLASSLGLGSADPQQMNADDYARLANYTRREHPDAMQQTIQQQPALLKAMGNPILMGALGMVASKMMRNRSQPAGLFG
ncbi:MAG TPA: hypothetical protein VMZ27_08860 [Candidatus Saccharimonadales bacterium]|nr:hypothetical protein [Candidatus Saccharimonadales bacterium]